MSIPLPPTGDGSSFAGDPSPLSQTFQQFRRILELNNAVIEKIAALERALSGEFVFDNIFPQRSVTEISELVREVIYTLNSLTGDRFPELYDRFETIRANLQDLAGGGQGPYSNFLVLPYSLLNRDLDHLAGGKNANLGEIRTSLALKTPDGFAVTARAYYLFMEENELFAKLTDLRAQSMPSARYIEALRQLFDEAVVPAPLAEAITAQVNDLLARTERTTLLAVRSSAVGEDGERSFAGQFSSQLGVAPAMVLTAYKKIIATRFSLPVLAYLHEGTDSREIPMAVGVQQMVSARVSGIIYSRDPGPHSRDLLSISAVAGLGAGLVAGREDADRYTVRRRHPFAVVASHVISKPTDQPLPDGLKPLAAQISGLRRGSAVLPVPVLRTLAEIGLLLEKAFEKPQDIEWAIDQVGQVIILQSRPLALPPLPPPKTAAVAEELRKASVLIDNRGQIAQLGVASGPVVHVTPEDDPATFPAGAVAVCRVASPQLSPIVRKAAAIITDIGSPTGHLATIAREYRTPALFGTGNASQLLPAGLEITVDVEERRIYAGIVQGLIDMQAAEAEPYLDTPELRLLRRLLRWIAPINLLDPGAPEFRGSNCRTFHDILRFCHEKAVDALIHLHSATTGIRKLVSRPLQLSVPIKIVAIDLGGGLPPVTGERSVAPEQIRSRPLRALLRGLCNDAVWDKEPAPFGFKDLLSGMTRPLTMLTSPPEYVGENLAIVAANYCNLSLRLGYHFNVIDAYLSVDPEDNYIYFRFVGGMAAQEKRFRRVTLIAAVLESLLFKVDCQGDLLVAKAKMLAPEHMEAILARLGELIAFTRQLDVRLVDDSTAALFYGRFQAQIRDATAGWPEK